MSWESLIDDLIAIRKERQLSQKQLSELCGVSQPLIGRLETKKNAPTLETVCKIAEVLGATIEIKG